MFKGEKKMIKIYGTERCSMCKTLELWVIKGWATAEYIKATPEQAEELQNKYDVTSFPIVLNDGELITFNDCMNIFKDERSKVK